MICATCLHGPSMRYDGTPSGVCQCECHDVADAAPELLAALERIMAEFVPLPEVWEGIEDVWEDAQAAIAKAKGEPRDPAP